MKLNSRDYDAVVQSSYRSNAFNAQFVKVTEHHSYDNRCFRSHSGSSSCTPECRASSGLDLATLICSHALSISSAYSHVSTVPLVPVNLCYLPLRSLVRRSYCCCVLSCRGSENLAPKATVSHRIRIWYSILNQTPVSLPSSGMRLDARTIVCSPFAPLRSS